MDRMDAFSIIIPGPKTDVEKSVSIMARGQHTVVNNKGLAPVRVVLEINPGYQLSIIPNLVNPYELEKKGEWTEVQSAPNSGLNIPTDHTKKASLIPTTSKEAQIPQPTPNTALTTNHRKHGGGKVANPALDEGSGPVEFYHTPVSGLPSNFNHSFRLNTRYLYNHLETWVRNPLEEMDMFKYPKLQGLIPSRIIEDLIAVSKLDACTDDWYYSFIWSMAFGSANSNMSNLDYRCMMNKSINADSLTRARCIEQVISLSRQDSFISFVSNYLFEKEANDDSMNQSEFGPIMEALMNTSEFKQDLWRQDVVRLCTIAPFYSQDPRSIVDFIQSLHKLISDSYVEVTRLHYGAALHVHRDMYDLWEENHREMIDRFNQQMVKWELVLFGADQICTHLLAANNGNFLSANKGAGLWRVDAVDEYRFLHENPLALNNYVTIAQGTHAWWNFAHFINGKFRKRMEHRDIRRHKKEASRWVLRKL